MSRVLDLCECRRGLLSYCFHLWSLNARVTHESPIVHHTFGVIEITYP